MLDLLLRDRCERVIVALSPTMAEVRYYLQDAKKDPILMSQFTEILRLDDIAIRRFNAARDLDLLSDENWELERVQRLAVIEAEGDFLDTVEKVLADYTVEDVKKR